jgi:tetratricopeptide (TPR) repeat protein
MNYQPQTDDEILRNLLYRTDVATPDDESDEADELFALLIDGKLDHHDRAHLLRCLDKNPMARQAVGLYLERGAALPQPATVPSSRHIARASGLWERLAVGCKRLGEFSHGILWPKTQDSTVRPSRPHLSEGGASPRVIPYAAQTAMACAALLLVATVAVLWVAWRNTTGVPLLAMRGGLNLMDLGYSPDPELGGEKGDDLQHTLNVQSFLETVPEESARDQLREGFGLLSRNLAPEARAVFERVLQSDPDSYYGLLGQGMAYFMENEYESAETAFRSAVQNHPDLIGAKINLAMTLARLGRDPEALSQWRRIPAGLLDVLPSEQQQAAAAELERLEAAPAE